MAFEHDFLMFIQQNLRFDWLTPFMKFVSFLGDSGWFFIVLALVLLVIPKTRKWGLFVTAAIILDILIVNGCLKPLVHRIRPYEVYQDLILLVKAESDFSFPSGHTGISCTTGFTLLFGLPKEKRVWGVAMTILALLVAWSRLYVAVHYPTDVLGAMIIAFVIAWVLMKTPVREKLDGIAKKICKK